MQVHIGICAHGRRSGRMIERKFRGNSSYTCANGYTSFANIVLCVATYKLL